LLFTRPNTSARRSSLVLIAVLFNRTSSGGLSVGTFLTRAEGDIIKEVKQGVQAGACELGHSG
jgi:hypothetical protein